MISYVVIVVNVTYLTKVRHGTKWPTQADGGEIIVPLCIIVHPKLNVFVPTCVDDFPTYICEK